jgi:hypothetical protein
LCGQHAPSGVVVGGCESHAKFLSSLGSLRLFSGRQATFFSSLYFSIYAMKFKLRPSEWGARWVFYRVKMKSFAKITNAVKNYMKRQKVKKKLSNFLSNIFAWSK